MTEYVLPKWGKLENERGPNGYRRPVSKNPEKIFAENAWLAPGRFVKRALITHDFRVRNIQVLDELTAPPEDALHVQWLLPGFTNAHCHLEYCWLRNRLPRGALPFGEWLQAIIAARQSQPDADTRSVAMKQGARELLAGGCTAVIDCTTDGSSCRIFEDHGLNYFLYFEVLGLTMERAQAVWQDMQDRMVSVEDGEECILSAGINPHAPYSVGPWLRDRLRSYNWRVGMPRLAWHLAETADENELFLTGTGSIADFLHKTVMPLPTESIPGTTAAGFLKKEGLLDLCDVAFHGNVLTDEEAAFFQAPRALVHCPSTNRWFSRPSVPIAKWLRSDINVCLGTDSLASSDTLSMLEIICITLEDNPDLTADEILRMACTNPAKIRNINISEGHVGALEVEGVEPYADFIALQSAVADGDLLRVLSCPETKVQQVWINGIERLGREMIPKPQRTKSQYSDLA